MPEAPAGCVLRGKRLADETGLTLIIRHLPPGTSKLYRLRFLGHRIEPYAAMAGV